MDALRTAVPAPGCRASLFPGLPRLLVAGGDRRSRATAVKALIASYPALAGTQLFVNEYGPPFATQIPGWIVGDFASLESAGADEGMLTCWTCSRLQQPVDGLIGYDGTPQMPYWVMMAYSQMSGDRLATSVSGANLYTLATRETGSQTVQALIGRADDCWGGQQCPQFHGSADAPVELSLTAAVTGAASTANVTIEPLPDCATGAVGSNDVPTAPAAALIDDVPVQSGIVTVSLGAADDGDAFFVTIRPNAGASSVGSAGGAVSSGASASLGASASSATHVSVPSPRRSARCAPQRRSRWRQTSRKRKRTPTRHK